ncbi:MAG TPA: META domain-containing protein [Anaerolineae bacterium]|nr:META domain-containing protein [Anaerolineae bacterium]
MKFKYLFLMMTAFALAACGANGEGIRPSDEDAFEDKTWVLTSYGVEDDLKTVLENTEITTVFIPDEAVVRGSSGCNHYFGNYEVTGNELSVSNIAFTEMACLTPEGVMEQEQLFLSVLAAVGSFQIQDNQLTIFSTDDHILEFKKK